MYKNIIFEFYDMLADIRIDEDTDLVWDKLSLFMTYHGADYQRDELKEAYHKNIQKQRVKYGNFDYPEADISDLFQKLYLIKGIKVKPKVLKDTVLMFRVLATEHIDLFEGVEPMLESLLNKGHKLFLLVNGQSVFLKSELKKLEVYSCFKGIYVSSDYHMAKPNPKLFKLVLDKEGLDKSETIVIGSSYKRDIKGAEKAGVDGLLFLRDSSDISKDKATYSVKDGDLERIKDIVS